MPRTTNVKLQTRRRLQIIEAAKRCFAARGFHQSSMREVIEETGLSTGAVYNYFPGKADIVKAIIEEQRQDIDFLITRLQGSDNPRTALSELGGNRDQHEPRARQTGDGDFCRGLSSARDQSSRGSK